MVTKLFTDTGASLSVVEGMILTGWGTQTGFNIRDMYLSVGVLLEGVPRRA